MSREQTEKSNYPSRYSPGGFVTPCQYIIELCCSNQAKSQHKDLPVRFWNLPEWNKIFVKQLRRGHALLKKYPAKAIISVINKKNIRSLLVPWLEDEIKAEVKILNIQQSIEKTPTEIIRHDNITFKQPDKINNKLSKLLELDNNG